MLKIEENKLHFCSILGLDGSYPNSLGPPGTLWDPLGGVPEGPRGGIKVGVQQESSGHYYIIILFGENNPIAKSKNIFFSKFPN